MKKTLPFDWRTVPRIVAVAASVLLIGAGVPAVARSSGLDSASAIPVQFNAPSFVGHSIVTSRGPAFITGHAGSADTVTLPGSGTQSFLTNNGNGSATLFTPGGPPQTVFTPR
jgi:hypothetical protein